MENEETIVCHCNIKENADLICRIMDYDAAGEVFDLNELKNWNNISDESKQ